MQNTDMEMNDAKNVKKIVIIINIENTAKIVEITMVPTMVTMMVTTMVTMMVTLMP